MRIRVTRALAAVSPAGAEYRIYTETNVRPAFFCRDFALGRSPSRHRQAPADVLAASRQSGSPRRSAGPRSTIALRSLRNYVEPVGAKSTCLVMLRASQTPAAAAFRA